MPTQARCGYEESTVSVDYYELVPPDTVTAGQRGVLELADAAQDGGSKSTDPGPVSDAQNPGVAHINVRTNDTNNGLTADVYLADRDGIDDDDTDPEGTAPVYTWEESINGRGGWETADPDGDAADDTSDQNLALADGNGKFYRLVITYTGRRRLPGAPCQRCHQGWRTGGCRSDSTCFGFGWSNASWRHPAGQQRAQGRICTVAAAG